jgi:hypothetical protein
LGAKSAASILEAKDDAVKKAMEEKKRAPKNKAPASGSDPPKQLAKKPKKAPPPPRRLKKADEDYVGDRVAKDFDGQVFFGKVGEVWFDDEMGANLWRIEYDDGDVEDLAIDDFIELLDLYEKEKDNDDMK